MPAVDKTAHEVVQEAVNAGVWVFGGALESQKASVVATVGTVTDGPYPDAIGVFCVVDVPSHAEALEWAAKFAAVCRCAQEVREFMPDPAVGNRSGSAPFVCASMPRICPRTDPPTLIDA